MDSHSFSLTKCINVLRFLSLRDATAMNLCQSALLNFLLYIGVSLSTVMVPCAVIRFGNVSVCVSFSFWLLRYVFISDYTGLESKFLSPSSGVNYSSVFSIAILRFHSSYYSSSCFSHSFSRPPHSGIFIDKDKFVVIIWFNC